MLAVSRKNKIRELILEKKSVTVTELAVFFGVTEETIRRDLRTMEDSGFLTRTHGGAFIQEGVQNDVHYRLRETAYLENKRRIAAACARFINHGDSIFLDPSTTALALCEHIRHKRVTVLTNSFSVAEKLKDLPNIKLIVAGGEFSSAIMGFIGNDTVAFMERYYVDKAFVSCRTLSLENGVTDSLDTMSVLRSLVIRRSNQVFLIADHSKFNRSSFLKICDFNEIDYLVVDETLPAEWHEAMERHSVRIVEACRG